MLLCTGCWKCTSGGHRTFNGRHHHCPLMRRRPIPLSPDRSFIHLVLAALRKSFDGLVFDYVYRRVAIPEASKTYSACLNSRRKILPEAVLGTDFTNRTSLGCL